MTNPVVAPDKHLVLVGPIRTDITLDDGTVIDVRPNVVPVDTLKQAAELAHKVGEHYAKHGHPHHDSGEKFVHTHKVGK